MEIKVCENSVSTQVIPVLLLLLFKVSMFDTIRAACRERFII